MDGRAVRRIASIHQFLLLVSIVAMNSVVGNGEYYRYSSRTRYILVHRIAGPFRWRARVFNSMVVGKRVVIQNSAREAREPMLLTSAGSHMTEFRLHQNIRIQGILYQLASTPIVSSLLLNPIPKLI